MPAKNKIKEYLANGYYHIYNRGVEKRNIFEDYQDEATFLTYLKVYLEKKDLVALSAMINDPASSPEERFRAKRIMRLNNFVGEIELKAFCLMPNHFHLLVKQVNERGIEKFMKSLGTRYVQYFNRRHGERVGGLFQDTYKAVLVTSEEQLLHLTRYIHRNPLTLQQGLTLSECSQASSYENYLGIVRQDWVKPQEVLEYFAKSGENSYRNFVEDSSLEEVSLITIAEFVLEDPGDTPLRTNPLNEIV